MTANQSIHHVLLMVSVMGQLALLLQQVTLSFPQAHLTKQSGKVKDHPHIKYDGQVRSTKLNDELVDFEKLCDVQGLFVHDILVKK